MTMVVDLEEVDQIEKANLQEKERNLMELTSSISQGKAKARRKEESICKEI